MNLNRFYRSALLASTLSISGLSLQVAHASSAHVHGQGQLLIAQEGQQWQFQFELPAADVLGFEHAPETQAQKTKLEETIAKLADSAQIIKMPNSCSLVSSSHSLDELAVSQHEDDAHEHGHDDGHKHDHDSHNRDKHDYDKHDHDKHEHHADDHDHDHKHDHEHDHKHGDSHADVTISYQYECDGALDTVSLSLFDWATSLSTLNAQWITNQGQGAVELSASSTTLNFGE